MNIGQVLENHLGWAARALGMEIDTTNLAAKLNAVRKTTAEENLRNLKQPSGRVG